MNNNNDVFDVAQEQQNIIDEANRQDADMIKQIDFTTITDKQKDILNQIFNNVQWLKNKLKVKDLILNEFNRKEVTTFISIYYMLVNYSRAKNESEKVHYKNVIMCIKTLLTQ